MRHFSSSTFTSLRLYSFAAIALWLLAACEGTIVSDAPASVSILESKSVPAPERTVAAGQVLFVVGDLTLGGGDDEVLARLEALGFTVTPRRGDQAQAADAAGMDLVVVSSTIQSSELGGRLRDVKVPVFTWESALYDEMRMTGTVMDTDQGGRDGQCKIDVVDAGHPIAKAAGLAAGKQQVTGSAARFHFGKPAAAAKIMARLEGSASKAAVFSYDEGATLVGGEKAAARRVGFFLADETAAQLDATGWKLFDAALIWAAGLPSSASGDVLLVVGDSNLSSGDAAIVTRLADLGLTTATLRGSQVQAADAAGRKLVIVSETVDSSTVGTRLRDVAVPLVSFEEGLYEELRLTGGVQGTDFGAVASQRKLKITAGHPIAVDAGLSGLTTVASSSDEFHFGKPVASAQVAATLENGKPALFTVAEGAALTSGTAPARRAGAWLSSKSAARLSGDGGRLFDATIRWALGTTPAGGALLVVGDTQLSPADAAARARLVALGFAVTVRRGSVAEAADAAGKQLVVITSTTLSTDLGDRLRDVAVPLVTWEPALFDDLRFAGPVENTDWGTVENQSKTDLLAHPITTDAGLAPGSVTVGTQPGEMRFARPVASAQIVARIAGSSSRASLFVFEAGAALRGGAAAPARRVGLWLGDKGAIRLTASGGKLFDAAIRWAAAAPAPVAKRAVLVTGDHDLEAGDSAARNRIAALGFSVEVWHQDALASLSTGDVKVIVIGESVQSAEVGQRFTAVAVPLVVAEAALFDDLAMTAAADQGFEAGQTRINIVNAAHPLAAGFPLGLLTVQNPANDLAWGRPAAAAVVVARAASTSTGRASIFAYESGATMVGRTAPARRVGHFFFRADQLTSAGGKLFDAAILWAAGGGGPVCVPATETCNGVDEDCDGQIDEGVKTTFYRDADGDGVGAAVPVQQACSAPAGYVASTGDCADSDPTRRPGAPEVCNDIDEDCDGLADDGVATKTFFRDQDGDGFGGATTLVDCAQPAGYATISGDCADTNPARFPGATEVCNLVDDDCDAGIDEGVKTTYFRDADGDGFGAASPTQQACSPPGGFVAQGGDCADGNAARFPGAAELCNDIDEDCDSAIDEGLPTSTYFRDQDGDGYGTNASALVDCRAPAGYVLPGGDCADNNIARHPNAPERCNDVDDDCDAAVDENAIDAPTWFSDGDGDGYGAITSSTKQCDLPTSPGVWIDEGGDCNDVIDAINPGAVEICDGLDNNCAGGVDGDTRFFTDGDEDGFGTGSALAGASCASPPPATAHVGGDCLDSDDDFFPGADETCDGLDNDCDLEIDEDAVDASELYIDADGDGFGDPDGVVFECSLLPGLVLNDDDCDDTSAGVSPVDSEIPGNGVDENCNGSLAN